MKSRICVSPQVEGFIKARAPEPRARLTRAVKGLARGLGDIKSLEGPLAGYSRLRVGGYRVIFAERCHDGERLIECVFAEARGIVYDLFERLATQEFLQQQTGLPTKAGKPRNSP